MKKMMSSKAALILLALFLVHTSATRYAPDKKRPTDQTPSGDGGGGLGAFFGPGSGFGIPGLGGGYGSGFGGPGGGSAKGGVIRPTVVCNKKGPCKGKKLACPASCFKSYSRAGKGYGGGGGGGGCSFDCTKKCAASCY
ncbi:unnamed protein product [Cuscuta epithymum]|uniref:Glycine-rich protein n=1 Tax=Cuscuta epithymum TaxID=186058 RepID=A0AAV0DB20_9ASTE|nr:unnamed protein product [Cuscuta epithymum]